ncbi:MAG: ATP-binding cassette domain-containing protein, partial [Bacteroidota bacterium]
MNTYLNVENATFSHTQTDFFVDFNWTVKKGENWIITGPVGSGKTSLIRGLAGHYFLKEGSLTYPYLAAQYPEITSSYTLKKKCIKVVSFKDDSRAFNPQSMFYSQRYNSFSADGTLTVWEYLMEQGFSEYEKEHVALLKRTGIFELLDVERIKLSSGQSRKLLITSAILQKPQLLMIDNPYMGLDAKSRQEFNDLLDNLVENEGIQLILAGQFEVLPKCIGHELALKREEVDYCGVLRSAADKNYESPKSLEKYLDTSYFGPLSPLELMWAKRDLDWDTKDNLIEEIK